MATDRFSNVDLLTAPARKLRSITPDDDNDLPNGVAKGLIAATSGNIAIIAAGDIDPVPVFCAAGVAIPIRAKRVLQTGTAATGIVALY